MAFKYMTEPLKEYCCCFEAKLKDTSPLWQQHLQLWVQPGTSETWQVCCRGLPVHRLRGVCVGGHPFCCSKQGIGKATENRVQVKQGRADTAHCQCRSIPCVNVSVRNDTLSWALPQERPSGEVLCPRSARLHA